MPTAIPKTTMKKQIILLASLFVLSFQTFAASTTEPILCESDERKELIDAMVNEESGATWKESFKAAGQKLSKQIDNILYNADAAAKTNPNEVRFLLKKASCIRATGAGMTVSDEFMVKYKAHDKEIRSKSGSNFSKMATTPQTVEEQNQVTNFELVFFNRDSVAFMRTLIEEFDK